MRWTETTVAYLLQGRLADPGLRRHFGPGTVPHDDVGAVGNPRADDCARVPNAPLVFDRFKFARKLRDPMFGYSRLNGSTEVSHSTKSCWFRD